MKVYLFAGKHPKGCKIALKINNVVYATIVEINNPHSYKCWWLGLKLLHKLISKWDIFTPIKNKADSIELYLSDETIIKQLKGEYQIREYENEMIKKSLLPYLTIIEKDKNKSFKNLLKYFETELKINLPLFPKAKEILI